MSKKLSWSHSGRESLDITLNISEGTIESATMQAVGCMAFLKLSQKMKTSLTGPISDLELPKGNDHGVMIWREVISQIQDEWQRPVPQDELCHCRRVSTETVDRAIVYGAHSLEEIRRRTSANTGCGTCKEDVMTLIGHRLDKT